MLIGFLLVSAAGSLPENPDQPVGRTLRVGGSYLIRTNGDLVGAHGGGMWVSYDYRVGDGHYLGVHTALRRYPGQDGTTQLGYGLLMKHHVFGKPADAVRLYVQYGLLLQLTWLDDRSGSATSHDTLLGLGLEGGRWFPGTFVQTGYHISRLGFFESSSIDVGYVSCTVGRGWSW